MEFTYYANDGTTNSAAPATVLITVRLGRVILPGDFNGDGFLTVLDVSGMVDAVYGGGPNPIISECMSVCADFNCDGFSDFFDVAKLIDFVYAGGQGPCNPCAR